MFNLRTDPFERVDITSNTYWDWMIDRAFLMVPAQAIMGNFSLRSGSFHPVRRRRAAPSTR
jgi:arylsulfatase